MSQIGTEQREIIVEPLNIPVPVRETPEAPAKAPQETPQSEPVGVPAR